MAGFTAKLQFQKKSVKTFDILKKTLQFRSKNRRFPG
jgi:hypothetical protein